MCCGFLLGVLSTAVVTPRGLQLLAHRIMFWCTRTGYWKQKRALPPKILPDQTKQNVGSQTTTTTTTTPTLLVRQNLIAINYLTSPRKPLKLQVVKISLIFVQWFFMCSLSLRPRCAFRLGENRFRNLLTIRQLQKLFKGGGVFVAMGLQTSFNIVTPPPKKKESKSAKTICQKSVKMYRHNDIMMKPQKTSRIITIRWPHQIVSILRLLLLKFHLYSPKLVTI